MKAHAENTQEDKNQSLADGESKEFTNNHPSFQFTDNRPQAIQQRKLQEMGNNRTRITQLKAIQQMADKYSFQQKHPPKNIIQRVINPNATIPDDATLHHGSKIEEFTTGKYCIKAPKDSNVPDGPAWFTNPDDFAEGKEDVLFNLQAAVRVLKSSGELFVHGFQPTKTLNIIGYADHDAAKEDLVKEDVPDDRKMPRINDRKMANLINQHSTAATHGYKYNEDLVRSEPEVVIFDTGNIKPNNFVKYAVKKWKKSEENGNYLERKIEEVNGNNRYRQLVYAPPRRNRTKLDKKALERKNIADVRKI